MNLALSQYKAGADLIYSAAGRTGLGVIEAARQTDKLTIGSNGDQRYLAPGNVVGNRSKNVDSVVLALIQEERSDSFKPGVRSLGLIEGGLRDVLELALPALLTVQTGINKPRYPSLSNLLRAKEQKAFVIDRETLPWVEEREEVLSSHYPGKSRIGLVLEGDQREKASQLLQLLEKKAFI